MARFYVPAEIENPEAYANAIQRRIKANRAKTGRAKLETALASEPELRAWLFVGMVEVEEGKYEKHPAGPVPQFLLDSMAEWGGLTAGQLAFARKCFAERTSKAIEIAAKRAEEKANSAHWTAGRQTIEAVLLSFREQESDFGIVTKGLFKCDDGRKVWMSVPSSVTAEKGVRIRCAVKIEPKSDDPTFAFGSRPTKVETL